MRFPDKLNEEQLALVVQEARVKQIHPIYTDGKVVVPASEMATRVAFFERGRAISVYHMRGDGSWAKCASPQSSQQQNT